MNGRVLTVFLSDSILAVGDTVLAFKGAGKPSVVMDHISSAVADAVGVGGRVLEKYQLSLHRSLYRGLPNVAVIEIDLLPLKQICLRPYYKL